MSVILTAASALSWASAALGASDETELLREVDADTAGSQGVVFLPYLAGERTPHADPYAQGVFFGMTHSTRRATLARAVLEGVAFAFADGRDALGDDTVRSPITVIGGGARSQTWLRILASALKIDLVTRENAELGPAFGAARLARMAATGESARAVCPKPTIRSRVEPHPEWADTFIARRRLYRDIYARLRPAFALNATIQGDSV
jgi:xylulokinase